MTEEKDRIVVEHLETLLAGVKSGEFRVYDAELTHQIGATVGQIISFRIVLTKDEPNSKSVSFDGADNPKVQEVRRKAHEIAHQAFLNGAFGNVSESPPNISQPKVYQHEFMLHHPEISHQLPAKNDIVTHSQAGDFRSGSPVIVKLDDSKVDWADERPLAFTDQTNCCSRLDWGGIDQTQEHHPECPRAKK